MAKISGKNIGDIPGTMKDFAGVSAPTNYLLCDGSSYSTATYPALFAAIGYTYGGSGSSFNVPNMKGQVSVGAGTAPSSTVYTLGETGGSELLQAHDHNTSLNENTPVVNNPTNLNPAQGNYALINAGAQNLVNWTSSIAGSGSSGNLQPFVVITKIIKY